jgi:lipopolysaccharide export system ATP-binding protein
MQIVLRLKDRGIGILITDHNVHETLSITERAYILIDGTIYKAGTAEELANDEHIRKLYLGETFKLERYQMEKKGIIESPVIESQEPVVEDTPTSVL